MNKPIEQDKKETAAASAGEKDQAGLLRASLLRKHPRMVYGNPDDFFLDLLMEELEEQ